MPTGEVFISKKTCKMYKNTSSGPDWHFCWANSDPGALFLTPLLNMMTVFVVLY